MKIKNGIDIIEISRIKDNIETNGNDFLQRVFTDKEIEYCESKKMQKYQSYAARFAGKEAIYKALSDYIKFDYSWKDFEIYNDKNGEPKVDLKFKIEELDEIVISLTHSKEYAVASVIAIYKET